MYFIAILISVSLLVSYDCRKSSKSHKSHSKNLAYDTPLYNFAVGAAEKLTSDKKVADECLVDYWKIKQPTVEAGTHVFFKDLVVPLLKIRETVESSIVQVCTKYANDFRGWLYENLDPTTTAEVQKVHKAAADAAAAKTATTATKKARKIFLQTGIKKTFRVSKKLRTQHWWKVLERSLPEIVEPIKTFKELLHKVLDGYVSVQFNTFIDCINKSVQTEDPLNRQLVAYRSLMRFVFKSKSMSEFLSVFTTLICNWDQFNSYIELLNNGVNEIDINKRWKLYGQAFAQLVISLATGVNLETRRR
jgi:hypothetical protein